MKIKRKSSVGCSPSQNQAMTNVVQRRCRARRAASSSSDGQLVISESGDLRDPLELFWISCREVCQSRAVVPDHRREPTGA